MDSILNNISSEYPALAQAAGDLLAKRPDVKQHIMAGPETPVLKFLRWARVHGVHESWRLFVLRNDIDDCQALLGGGGGRNREAGKEAEPKKFRKFPLGWVIGPKAAVENPAIYPDNWQAYSLNSDFSLVCDRELSFMLMRKGSIMAVLLGYAIDIDKQGINGEAILADLLNSVKEGGLSLSDGFYDIVERLAGRYAICLIEGDSIVALNDPAGLRNVYYHLGEKIISSHYNLIARVFPSPPDAFSYDELQKDCKAKGLEIPWHLPADLSPFKDIKLLVPNYLLDLKTHTLSRFWPRKEPRPIKVTDAAAIIAQKLKFIIEQVSSVYKPILSLSSGFDSRMSLAALLASGIKFKSFSYMNRNAGKYSFAFSDFAHGCKVGAMLAKIYGFAHEVIDYADYPPDKNDLEILYATKYQIHNAYLATQFKNIESNSIHIRSNVYEVIRHSYFDTRSAKSLDDLADILAKSSMYDPAMECYGRVIDIYKDYIKRLNIDQFANSQINYGDLFYIEYRMAQWISIIGDFDSFSDAICPINCRKLIELAFAVPKEIKDRNKLAELVIEANAPDLMAWSVYPNHRQKLNTLKDYYIGTMPGFKPFVSGLTGNWLFKLDSRFKKPGGGRLFCDASDNHAIFGFQTADVNQGDEIAWKYNFSLEPGKIYRLTFTLASGVESADSQECATQIRVSINGKTVGEGCAADFYPYRQESFQILARQKDNTLEIKTIPTMDLDINSRSLIKISDLFINVDERVV